MAWRKMLLRGQKVLARCNDDGSLLSQGGRVEIRYRPNDGRSYAASARNLQPLDPAELLPDDHCGPAERPETSRQSASPSSGNAKSGKTNATSSSEPSSAPTQPEPGMILAYADGACSGNPGPAGLGVVMLWEDHRRELSEYLGQGTNNIAELTAILRAAEAAREIGLPLRLYTDSSYSIGVLVKGWKAKKNTELVAAAKDALRKLDDVRLYHVRGHMGAALNERADDLAVQAVSRRASKPWKVVATRA